MHGGTQSASVSHFMWTLRPVFVWVCWVGCCGAAPCMVLRALRSVWRTRRALEGLAAAFLRKAGRRAGVLEDPCFLAQA